MAETLVGVKAKIEAIEKEISDMREKHRADIAKQYKELNSCIVQLEKLRIENKIGQYVHVKDNIQFSNRKWNYLRGAKVKILRLKGRVRVVIEIDGKELTLHRNMIDLDHQEKDEATRRLEDNISAEMNTMIRRMPEDPELDKELAELYQALRIN